MPNAEAIVDRALGIDDAVKAKIAATVREIFPGRSAELYVALEKRAKAMWSVGDDEMSRSLVAALKTIDPALARGVPTPQDITDFKEAEAKRLGLGWDAQKRLSAFREAQGMDDAARLAAVPSDLKLADAKKEAEPMKTVPTTAEARDAEIEKRFGLTAGTARSMSAIKRRDLHAALEREEAGKATGKKSDNADGGLEPKGNSVRDMYHRMSKRPVIGRKTG